MMTLCNNNKIMAINPAYVAEDLAHNVSYWTIKKPQSTYLTFTLISTLIHEAWWGAADGRIQYEETGVSSILLHIHGWNSYSSNVWCWTWT